MELHELIDILIDEGSVAMTEDVVIDTAETYEVSSVRSVNGRILITAGEVAK